MLFSHAAKPTQEQEEPEPNPTAISQRRMQLAGAVEDIVDEHLFVFVNQLKDDGLLTEQQVRDSLAKFHESLQTAGT